MYQETSGTAAGRQGSDRPSGAAPGNRRPSRLELGTTPCLHLLRLSDLPTSPSTSSRHPYLRPDRGRTGPGRGRDAVRKGRRRRGRVEECPSVIVTDAPCISSLREDPNHRLCRFGLVGLDPKWTSVGCETRVVDDPRVDRSEPHPPRENWRQRPRPGVRSGKGVHKASPLPYP